MPDLIALLEHIEGLAAEQARALAELRAAIAEAQLPSAGNGLDPGDMDDFAGANLIDTHAAEARFGYPRNTIARSNSM